MSRNISDRLKPADADEFKRVVDAVAESVLEGPTKISVRKPSRTGKIQRQPPKQRAVCC